MAGIFICYRRADAEGWAGRLSDSLKAEMGRINIFRDIEDIPPGVEFDSYINDAVGSCGVLIALIGPRWLTEIDKNGVRRLDDPKDFTRLEVLTALKRNVLVIPALVGGAQMPDVDELPEDIKPLARRQAYELSDTRWVDDCRKLAMVLRPIVKPDRSHNFKIAAIALVALAGAGYGVKLWNDYRVKFALQESATSEKNEQERVAQLKETAAGEAAEPKKLAEEKTAGKGSARKKSDAGVRPQENFVITGTNHSFAEKNGHLVSTRYGNPICPTPPGWRTGCYALEPSYRQSWRNTPDGYVANGKKIKTFTNRGERIFELLGTKHAFYVDDGYLYYYPTATILCPWPKAGVARCQKIDAQYEGKWRNTPTGFIANGREFDSIEVMRRVRQGLF